MYDVFLLYIFCITFHTLGIFGSFLLTTIVILIIDKKKSFVHNIMASIDQVDEIEVTETHESNMIPRAL